MRNSDSLDNEDLSSELSRAERKALKKTEKKEKKQEKKKEKEEKKKREEQKKVGPRP